MDSFPMMFVVHSYMQILPIVNNFHLDGLSITYMRSMFSSTWFTLFVWPSVWGWWAVLKFIFVPKSANKPFQKMEVKLGSLRNTISLGNPCNLKISFMKIFFCNGISHISGLNQYKTWFLCQLVHHNHDGIMLSPSHWKTCNKIHGNNFSFPF